MPDNDDERWELWGPLAERYRSERPRRILALDGGGIRGVMTLGVLAQLEADLAAANGRGDDFRLCDFFDLIGGTSTGAIIAAGLARRMSVGEIAGFYEDFGKIAFSRRKLWMRWQSLYGDGKLANTLKETFGEDTDLKPEQLSCLLTVVTRNATTDSAWPVSSNPFAKYNDPARPDCNLNIPLWKLVRASTAAPVFFPPEVIEWDPRDESKSFVFVDGGTTPYNNPAFLLYRMSVAPAYRLNWKRGERNLLIVSVGTGSAPVLGSSVDDPESNVASAALNTLSALMSQASVDQDVNCRVVGRCTFGGVIDRELHDLLTVDPSLHDQPLTLEDDLGRDFLYVRYNAELTTNGLAELGLGDSGIDPEKVQKMDAVDNLDELQEIGAALAKRVDLAHLGAFARV
jgi:hypothetical protein